MDIRSSACSWHKGHVDGIGHAIAIMPGVNVALALTLPLDRRQHTCLGLGHALPMILQVPMVVGMTHMVWVSALLDSNVASIISHGYLVRLCCKTLGHSSLPATTWGRVLLVARLLLKVQEGPTEQTNYD
jgi:hypothetical protein